MSVKTEYAFRAEVISDVLKLLKLPEVLRSVTYIKIEKEDQILPDVEVKLVSTLSLEELRKQMREVEDGHVMVQTLNYKNEYTGERDYDLD